MTLTSDLSLQGILTGMSKRGYSISINERNLGGNLVANALEALLRHAWSPTHLARHVCSCVYVCWGGGECASTNNILTGELPLPPVFCHLYATCTYKCAQRRIRHTLTWKLFSHSTRSLDHWTHEWTAKKSQCALAAQASCLSLSHTVSLLLMRVLQQKGTVPVCRDM